MKSMLASDDLSNSVIQKYLAEQEHARKVAQLSMGEDSEKLDAELKKQQNTQNVLVQKIMTEVGHNYISGSIQPSIGSCVHYFPRFRDYVVELLIRNERRYHAWISVSRRTSIH